MIWNIFHLLFLVASFNKAIAFFIFLILCWHLVGTEIDFIMTVIYFLFNYMLNWCRVCCGGKIWITHSSNFSMVKFSSSYHDSSSSSMPSWTNRDNFQVKTSFRKTCSRWRIQFDLRNLFMKNIESMFWYSSVNLTANLQDFLMHNFLCILFGCV